MIPMAEGEQHPFGHQLFCLFRLTTETMHHPQLRLLPSPSALFRHLPPKCQQFVQRPDTMNHHRFPHFFRNGHLRTKGFLLHGQRCSTHPIQSTLTYRPYILSPCFPTDGVNGHLPTCIHLPRMQTHRQPHLLRVRRQQLRRIHIQQTRLLLGMICVEIKHRLPMELLWHRVIATSPPRVAAKDTAASQIEPLQRAMLLDGLQCIGRACGCETARRRQQRRDAGTIEVDGKQEKE